MEDSVLGLVRYHGVKMSRELAQLLKANIHHNKARKYAPKGVNPADISASIGDVDRIAEFLSPESRAEHERYKAYAGDILGLPEALGRLWKSHPIHGTMAL